MEWKRFFSFCPTCKNQPRIAGICTNDNGDILLEMFCGKCNTKLSRTITSQEIINNARDIKYINCLRANQLPSFTTEEKVHDKNFLREMRICV